MKIIIGSDHAGYHLKQHIVEYVRYLGYDVEDAGTHDTHSVDYPDIGRKVAQSVARGEYDRGILICGTGIGMCITANKIKGVRAALCHDTYSAAASRDHNDANVLCMGGRVIGPGLASDVVKTWLATPFSEGERHARRVNMMNALDDDR